MNQTNSHKKVLHVGCGKHGKIHQLFSGPAWSEIRLDIDPEADPDIVNSITDMENMSDHSVDAVYSSHNLEHLYPHEVKTALQEFLRVLNSEGFCLLSVPDLQAAAELIAQGKIEEPLYNSPAGPVAPLDMLYGFRPALAAGNTHMAHKTGFTDVSLAQEFINAGFTWAKYAKDNAYSLWIKAYKNKPPADIAEQPLW